MNKASNPLLKFFLTCLLISLPGIAGSQTYKFEEFGLEEGICDRYIYTINQGTNGYLWIGAGTGLCRFDGFDFREGFIDDSVTNSLVNKSYKDSKGCLWFGHIDGSITFYDGSDFTSLPVEEKQKNRINDITESVDSLLYIVTQSPWIS